MVEQQLAKNADRAMIGQARAMLHRFGVMIQTAMHSAGEPAVLTRVLDRFFSIFWKEVAAARASPRLPVCTHRASPPFAPALHPLRQADDA